MDIKRIPSTPIIKLSEKLNDNSFYIKRDDLLPISFGGNKARKAILFFEDLIQKKCNYVVTYGARSSNHCRIIANISASLRIPCCIITPDEHNKPTYNYKLTKLFGAMIRNCSVAEVSITIEETIERLKADGYRPYFIQGGGHGDIGTQAYVKAYEEIREYESGSNVYFDYIFHTSGTGTTQAGLICGQLIHNDQKEIIGISNARKNPHGRQIVLESVNSYIVKRGMRPIAGERINFIDDYVIDGYGSYNKQIMKTIKEVLLLDGVPMDRIYTGKAYWGMREYIKTNRIKGKAILFIHTGGVPLFFDGLEELINGE